jgi:probable F420-dependent oxidoreductase
MAAIDKFGLDVGVYGALAEPATILRLGRLAEDVGFDSIWLADHVAFPVTFRSEYPYSAKGDFPSKLDDPLMEPVAVMGVLVGATRRVRIGTAVLIMPYRNPLLLARMLATLDTFSGGRIILGAGVGWLEEEFEVLGNRDFKRRGKATDEAIEIFKAICAGGEVGFQGETYSFAPVYSNPGSAQRPHPPVLIGGLADAALRRVARHGTGWLAVTAGPEKLAERLQTLARMMDEAGRSMRALSLNYKIFLNIGAPKRSKFDAREPGTGSEAEIIDDLKKIFDLGFERVIVRYRGSSADELTRQIDRFVTEIVPRI